MKYLSNFHREFFGTQYAPGDEIKVPKGNEDELKGAVTDGIVTTIDDGDPKVPALGGDTEMEVSADSAFDHDGDGRPGGAPKGGNAKK